jgi:hypothetical protein
MAELLPHLAASAREARVAAALTYAHVAVHVAKRSGRTGVSESTIARFEYGGHWPENPDAIVSAYAEALDMRAGELWARAVDALRHEENRRR